MQPVKLAKTSAPFAEVYVMMDLFRAYIRFVRSSHLAQKVGKDKWIFETTTKHNVEVIVQGGNLVMVTENVPISILRVQKSEVHDKLNFLMDVFAQIVGIGTHSLSNRIVKDLEGIIKDSGAKVKVTAKITNPNSRRLDLIFTSFCNILTDEALGTGKKVSPNIWVFNPGYEFLNAPKDKRAVVKRSQAGVWVLEKHIGLPRVDEADLKDSAIKDMLLTVYNIVGGRKPLRFGIKMNSILGLYPSEEKVSKISNPEVFRFNRIMEKFISQKAREDVIHGKPDGHGGWIFRLFGSQKEKSLKPLDKSLIGMPRGLKPVRVLRHEDDGRGLGPYYSVRFTKENGSAYTYEIAPGALADKIKEFLVGILKETLGVPQDRKPGLSKSSIVAIGIMVDHGFKLKTASRVLVLELLKVARDLT